MKIFGLITHDDCKVYLNTSVEDVPLAVNKFATMCHEHQRLAECLQISAERGEDTAVMALLESACRQGRLPRRPGRHSLLFGISDGLLRRLQSVLNATARLVTGARRCDHITLVLRHLHWLPVRQRVVIQIADTSVARRSGSRVSRRRLSPSV